MNEPLKISLSPEALAALNAGNDEPLKTPTKPLSMGTQRVIHKQVARALFGPSMKPTFKQQLLTFVSFAAIKTCWAADHFLRVQTAKKIKDALLA